MKSTVAPIEKWRVMKSNLKLDHVIFPDGKRIILLGQGPFWRTWVAAARTSSWLMSLLVRQPDHRAD